MWEMRLKCLLLTEKLMTMFGVTDVFSLCCRGFAGAWLGEGAHDQAEGRAVRFEARCRGADQVQVLSAKLLSEPTHTLRPHPRPCPLGSREVRLALAHGRAGISLL